MFTENTRNMSFPSTPARLLLSLWDHTNQLYNIYAISGEPRVKKRTMIHPLAGLGPTPICSELFSKLVNRYAGHPVFLQRRRSSVHLFQKLSYPGNGRGRSSNQMRQWKRYCSSSSSLGRPNLVTNHFRLLRPCVAGLYKNGGPGTSLFMYDWLLTGGQADWISKTDLQIFAMT